MRARGACGTDRRNVVSVPGKVDDHDVGAAALGGVGDERGVR